MKDKYYSLTRILEKNAQYNMIIGERSNGKTYAILDHCLEEYVKKGSQFAIVRRWEDDFKNKRGASMFDNLINNGRVAELTKGEWTSVHYYAGRWFLSRRDANGNKENADEPFAYAFAVSTMEHDKSTSYPRVKNIFFDEFNTRSYYLPDEFVLFMNVVSTIVRQRNDVTIFMAGNTISKNCPYFSEMGLTHIKDMKQGSIDVYTYGDSDLKVAVEFSDGIKGGKKSDLYFAFDNPKLHMITGSGNAWEIGIYPHLPVKYKPSEIIFTYIIQYDGDMLQCEVIQKDNMTFTFIHRKTTPLRDPDRDIVYSPEYDPRPNWRRRITLPTDKLSKKLYQFYLMDKVYYQDNEIGEIVRNYLQWSSRDN